MPDFGKRPNPLVDDYDEETMAKICALKKRQRRWPIRALRYSLASLSLTCLTLAGYSAVALYTDLLETPLPSYVLQLPRNSCLRDAESRRIPARVANEACGCMVGKLKYTFGIGETTRMILTAVSGIDLTREFDDYEMFVHWDEFVDRIGYECILQYS